PSRNQLNYREQINNTYSAVGPTQNGGRTRAVVFDVRYNGTTNKVIMAGGITGGLFRSTDGGATWNFVSPENDIRSISCIVQDPRPGFQDTWYAGTGGEITGSSTGYPNIYFVPGYGIFKSIDNGATWSKLSSTIAGDQTPPTGSTLVDNAFDMVFRLAVNPGNGDVYAALLNRVSRSTNGGSTWSTVLNSTSSQYYVGMITDVAINNNGSRIYASISGRNLTRAKVGVFASTTGALNSWNRIAGGTGGSADSVAGWKGYDNTIDPNLGFTVGYEKIILAPVPSNSNLLYVMYNYGVNTTSINVQDADLFKADLTSYDNTNANTVAWSNLSTNLSALRNGTTAAPLNTQGGYDMYLAVHPTNANLIIAGGTNLYRSTNGFTTPGAVKFIGGYSSSTYTDPNVASHPDQHYVAFDPSSPNRMVAASDGGLYKTEDVTATTVAWDLFNSQYQTIQYYHVAIDPETGSQAYAGGAQDNATTYRDANALLGAALTDPNDHYILIGGDGGAAGITKKNGLGKQYLFGASQSGSLYRMQLFPTNPYNPNNPYNLTAIKPNNTATDNRQFITYFHLDPDNTNNLYFVSNDSIWRTTSSTTVNSSTWTAMTGVGATLTSGSGIYALETTRGTYSASSNLFIGTDNSKLYRLADPANAAAATAPVDITPGTIDAGAVITDIAVNPRNQDTLMFVCSNYGVQSIWWTGNATSATPTWQSVEGNISLPSVRSCAIVVTSTGVEYYVGTSIGLYSTSIINSTSTVWANEGSGMIKTAVVNSLALRTSDNTLLVGTHGNGMFVTNIGNVATGVNDPIINDKNFVQAVWPTVISNTVNIRKGNLNNIKKLDIRLYSSNGQLLLKRQDGYQDLSIDVSRLAAGSYFISISSGDNKYRTVQQLMKPR
ncbi:MAG: T9SS type A sorting domain-containing protein, partial [Sphingobacteriales bacterium]|nr:T9SS type A sorting domain-containing protein [Sphingobacteriales bacterium]